MRVLSRRVVWATVLCCGLLGCAGADLLGQKTDASVSPHGSSVSISAVSISAPSLTAKNVSDSVANASEIFAELPDAPPAAGQPAIPANGEKPSPRVSQPNAAADQGSGKQTKRILYILPNFRSVDANSVLRPQTVRQKFITATQDSVDYSSFVFYGLQAGVALASKSYPEFHSGLPGYGRYYWHIALDSTSENYWVEFLIPSALHQDTRFYTLGSGSFPKRFVYAFTRIVVTRSDRGGETFNASEIVGAGAAAGMSNLYYPSQERTFTKTYQRWVTSLLIDGGVFVLKEFWPDVNSRLVHEQN